MGAGGVLGGCQGGHVGLSARRPALGPLQGRPRQRRLHRGLLCPQGMPTVSGTSTAPPPPITPFYPPLLGSSGFRRTGILLSPSKSIHCAV